ncbi:MAG: tol-pal system protein YbgF [Paracoccaceae bacterium]
MRFVVRARVLAVVLTVLLTAVFGAPAMAQQETLADIRQQLSFLFVDIQRLKQELSTTGGVSSTIGGSSALERIDLIEAELERLTSKTEQLEERIVRIVADGTNRLGDLEFRLIELEGGDVSQLSENSTLGGEFENVLIALPQPDNTPQTAELAIGEQGDFDRARAALDEGNFADAVQLFVTFSDTYSGGPLAGEAEFFRGEALFALGDTANAARAYLESFSGTPQGPRAPDALYRLGVSLGDLGQINEACISLAEVGVRFVGAQAVTLANSAMLELDCP